MSTKLNLIQNIKSCARYPNIKWVNIKVITFGDSKTCNFALLRIWRGFQGCVVSPRHFPGSATQLSSRMTHKNRSTTPRVGWKEFWVWEVKQEGSQNHQRRSTLWSQQLKEKRHWRKSFASPRQQINADTFKRGLVRFTAGTWMTSLAYRKEQ